MSDLKVVDPNEELATPKQINRTVPAPPGARAHEQRVVSTLQGSACPSARLSSRDPGGVRSLIALPEIRVLR